MWWMLTSCTSFTKFRHLITSTGIIHEYVYAKPTMVLDVKVHNRLVVGAIAEFGGQQTIKVRISTHHIWLPYVDGWSTCEAQRLPLGPMSNVSHYLTLH